MTFLVRLRNRLRVDQNHHGAALKLLGTLYILTILTQNPEDLALNLAV